MYIVLYHWYDKITYCVERCVVKIKDTIKNVKVYLNIPFKKDTA